MPFVSETTGVPPLAIVKPTLTAAARMTACVPPPESARVVRSNAKSPIRL